jgi:UDPglucose 6-dehydrogenase/GDP-mannose 6-dehydrogenase
VRIAVVGTGYVGLVTAVCLAEKGHEIVCVDVDSEKIDRIRLGRSPIHEPGLEELLRRNVGTRLLATTNLHQAVLDSEATLIAVGTPLAGQAIDLTQIREAARDIGTALRRTSTYHLVVVKSTVVPGTTDDIVTPILEATSGKKAGHDFGIGMNPEFLTEGEAVNDFLFPDRLILGGLDLRTIDTLAALYSPFEGVNQLRTNNRTAEMVKYTSNALLATAISFSNEIANLCGALGGIDVVEVMQGVHLSKYLSLRSPDGSQSVAPLAAFLWAGCGFGGSCLPKDVKALISHGQRAGQSMSLLEAVICVNDHQPHQLSALLRRHFPSLKSIRVAILGLAFRPGTDDMRESPALPIINELLAAGVEIKAYDPAANQHAAKMIRHHHFVLADDLVEVLTNVDAVVLVTRWEEFSRVPRLLAGLRPQPVFIDGRRMLDKRSVALYDGIGL